jgi:WS/DGAT/MGAT family acyltransferase
MLGRRRVRGAHPAAPSLSRPIGAHRRFEVLRVALTDVKEIKNRFDCTVNDVVLALVTGGMRRLLETRGEAVPGVVLQAMVPVSVRDDSDQTTYGNKVSMVTTDLPVGERNPRRRLELLRGSMAAHMQSRRAVGADFWVKLSEYASPTILGLAGRATAFGKSPVHVTITNVPGPQSPLYLLGGQMLEAFPCVPIAGVTSLGVAVHSYNGQLHFGLTGDWDATPDLSVLASGIQEAVRELQEIARIGAPEGLRSAAGA